MQNALEAEKNGEIDEAIRLYYETLSNSPQAVRAHLDLAVLLHDRKQDYIKAIYHYERYLEQRPDTEKRSLIENRARIAGQQYAAKISSASQVSNERLVELEKENLKLRDRVKELEKQVARREEKRENEPGVVVDADKPPRVVKPPPREEGAVFAEMTSLRTYSVRSGDTLSSIALKFYGDETQSARIFDANKDMLDSRNNLKIGTVLVIP